MIDHLLSAADTAWMLMNSLARLGIMLIVVYKLTRYRHRFICPERVGLSLAGGAGFLTIPVIWTAAETPFEGWASAIFALGVFIYLCGRMSRTLKHERANKQAVEQARAHFAGKGRR